MAYIVMFVLGTVAAMGGYTWCIGGWVGGWGGGGWGGDGNVIGFGWVFGLGCVRLGTRFAGFGWQEAMGDNGWVHT